MSKYILKELSELLAAQVITEETAQRIRDHYHHQESQSASRLFVVFGILGALLTGMGIVLIIAHNWDVLPKAVKLFVGFIPLVTGQVLSVYALIKKPEAQAWREGSATFLFFAIGISISIVSQVYHIEGDLSGFLFTWMCLALPVVYLLRSSIASMLCIAGITCYACEIGYFNYPRHHAIAYWILLGLLLPFYYLELVRKNIKNNFFYLHSWLLVLSLTISMATWGDGSSEIMIIAYMSLFSLFIQVSQLRSFETNRVLANAYLVAGSLGVILLLLFLSFAWYWDELAGKSLDNIFQTLEFAVSSVVTVAAVGLLFHLIKTKGWKEINSKSYAFILFFILFFAGLTFPRLSQWLVNVLILLLAVHTIRDGAQRNHLGILNYGLLIITGLIGCRFFDTDFSFVVRGVLFIAVGVAFFFANSYMVQKRRNQL